MRDSAEDWKRVGELFEEALKLPCPEQRGFVDAQAEHESVRAEVLSLLEVYEDAPAAGQEASPASWPQERSTGNGSPFQGVRIGPWRLVREIGAGAVDVVWEAEEVNGRQARRVAIRLGLRSPVSGSGAAQFRAAWQMLAQLDHPAIARVLDGGTTEGGAPYLVTEYIEGQPLDAWWRENEPGLRDRIQVFLAICAAVDYAHRHLVIHGGLKPAGILVTQDGTPKLFGFGGAKLFATGSAAATGSPASKCASPEQMRGESATPASDIYALGVLLSDLASAAGATSNRHRIPLAGGTDEILDEIVFRSVCEDPEERYGSVQALADDVRMWLGYSPASAVTRPRQIGRIRLIIRGKAWSVAAAAVGVLLLGGAAAAVRQVEAARLERHRAEIRLHEMQGFSRSMLSDLPEAIRDLPEASPARTMLLAQATRLFDGVAQEAGQDAALRVNLAEGYRRLARVQTGPGRENGVPDAALESYRKAARLGESAVATEPGNPAAGMVLLGAYDDLATAFQAKNDAQDAEVYFAKHRELLKWLEQRYPADQRVRVSVAAGYGDLAYFRAQHGDLSGAKSDYRTAARIFGGLQQSGYDLKDARAQYAVVLTRLGALLVREGSLDEAEACYRTALPAEDAAQRASPADLQLLMDRTETLSNLAMILQRRADLPGAARMYEDVVAARRTALQTDPRNVRLIRLTAGAEVHLAAVDSALKRYWSAIDVSREAVRRQDNAVAASHAFRDRMDAAAVRVALAHRLLDASGASVTSAARWRWRSEAATALGQAKPMLDELERTAVPTPADRELLAEYRNANNRISTLQPLRRKRRQR